jgi:hypothetical protein
VGKFDNDPYDDLAVGVPNEDIEVPPSITIVDAGAVNILFGTETGLDDAGVRFAYQDGEDIEETAEEGDQFGHTLAAVDFYNRGLDNLVVGVPYEDLGDPVMTDAGAVHVLTYYAFGNYKSTDSGFFHQGRDSIPDDLVWKGRFGHALAGGDFNGDGGEELAVGNPYDHCEGNDEGSLVVLYDTSWDRDDISSPQRWCQGGGLLEQPEAEDNFGYALVSIPGSGALPYRNYLPSIVRDE